MNAGQVTLLLIATSPCLLVSLGIALWRHKFLGPRFAVASLSSAVGGISVGWASATALSFILSKVSPGFPGIGGGFILLGFGLIMSVAMGLAVGIWFPTDPPKTSEDPFNPAGCTVIVLLVGTVVVISITAFSQIIKLL